MRPRRQRLAAFTLIEMIGVLAVIAVLAAMLLPRWIKRIDLKVQRAEISNLTTISNALVTRVTQGVALPDASTWRNVVASGSAMPLSKVNVNRRKYSRVYYCEAGANPASGYTQGLDGFQNPPQNLRAMVVSILGGNELDASNCPLPGGGQLSTADFDELWNLRNDTRPTTGSWANWNGQPDDFLVQRVHYAPLFHHLVLLNRETNDLPRFTINGTLCPADRLARTMGAHNPGWSAYYLKGTVVGLCNPASQTVTRYVLDQDIGFVWEKGKWRAEILGDPNEYTLGDDFSQKAKEFIEAVRYNAKGGDQQGVVTAMYDFMLSYVYWANQCPRFATHGSSERLVAEYRIIEWIGGSPGLLDSFSLNLVTKSPGSK